MKKLYALLFIAFAFIANAQIVNIPDANFKAKLLSASASNQVASTESSIIYQEDPNGTFTIDQYSAIDVNNDGEIQLTESQLVKFLDVRNSLITNLEGINNFDNLEHLVCSQNQISNLNISNLLNLRTLHCYYNNILSIIFPSSSNLGLVKCHFNMVTQLDVSNLTGLEWLECQNNNLISLNVKNSYTGVYNWYKFYFFSNPNLQYICADEEDVSMVQSKINAYGYASTCHVNSYCSFTPGGTFYTIEGNNRFDGDTNGCDSNDFGYPYLKFNVTDGTSNGNFIANEAGEYFYDVHAETHTLTPQLENPTYFNISPTSVTVDFPAQASPFTQDFCITPNSVHHDLEVTIIPLGVARPGFDASYKVVYKNKGNQLANPILTFAFDDAVMDYLSASVSATSQSSGLITWNLPTLPPLYSGNIVVNFNLNTPIETPPLNGDDILNYTATINPTATDETPTDNVFTLNQTVVNSYDPNDKTCLEGETINPNMIGEYVHYQIRFENTGTYPAQNVVVKDMIDATKFDISTLQMISSSHSCYTRINGNKVEFIFENINLPFDDATNDGYVVFKIKALPTLTINSTISNTAEIYFDYNFPIVTNTATSTYKVLANPDFDFANEFGLYPNPVKNILNISAKNGLEIQSLEIYNSIGQLVIAKPNFEQTIDVSSLPTGTYFIKASTEKGSGSVKFVKQ